MSEEVVEVYATDEERRDAIVEKDMEIERLKNENEKLREENRELMNKLSWYDRMKR